MIYSIFILFSDVLQFLITLWTTETERLLIKFGYFISYIFPYFLLNARFDKKLLIFGVEFYKFQDGFSRPCLTFWNTHCTWKWFILTSIIWYLAPADVDVAGESLLARWEGHSESKKSSKYQVTYTSFIVLFTITITIIVISCTDCLIHRLIVQRSSVYSA